MHKSNMRNVDKENQSTRAYSDIPLRYERDGNYVNGTSGYARVTCFSVSTLRMLRLRTSQPIVLKLMTTSSHLVLTETHVVPETKN